MGIYWPGKLLSPTQVGDHVKDGRHLSVVTSGKWTQNLLALLAKLVNPLEFVFIRIENMV